MPKSASITLYKQQLRSFIVTSRFNTETWRENQEFRKSQEGEKARIGSFVRMLKRREFTILKLHKNQTT
jgi:hypothetical protein